MYLIEIQEEIPTMKDIEIQIRSMIEDMESGINLIESMIEFSFGNNEGRGNMEDWCSNPLEYSEFQKLLLKFNNVGRDGVRECFHDELSIFSDKIESTEKTFNSSLSQAIMLLY